MRCSNVFLLSLTDRKKGVKTPSGHSATLTPMQIPKKRRSSSSGEISKSVKTSNPHIRNKLKALVVDTQAAELLASMSHIQLGGAASGFADQLTTAPPSLSTHTPGGTAKTFSFE